MLAEWTSEILSLSVQNIRQLRSTYAYVSHTMCLRVPYA